MRGGIERFNIADIARIHGIQTIRENGVETYAVCPFCGDKRGKFSYFVKKGSKENLYKCFNCGEGGTAIDLFMKLSAGKNYSGSDGYKAAIKDIFKAINGDDSFVSFHKETLDKTERVAAETVDKASDEQISKVYYSLLKILILKDEHKADLKRRGLTDEEIKRYRFRSVPMNPKKVVARLVAAGLDLKGVPGFYKDRNGHWSMSLSGTKDEKGRWKPDGGYFCPVFDGERNLILGFQIRLDVPKDKTKYLWFSSAGKDCGVSSGAIATFLPGKSDKILLIAEGILKATIIYSLLKGEISVVGVPGTKNIKSLESYLERYEGRAYAFEAYDMDKAIRVTDETSQKDAEKTVRIAEDRDKLLSLISAYGIQTHPLKWDMDKEGLWKGEYKGLDDFLVEYPEKEKFLTYLQTKAQGALKMQEYFKKCA